MEPDDVDPSPPPFWYHPPTPTILRRRGPLSLILNPVVLILTVPIITLLVLYFIVPPLLSHTQQILRPKSWDSLNVVLVLFAILCGVFARRNDDEVQPPSPSQLPSSSEINRESTVNVANNYVDIRPRQPGMNWLDFPDQREYNRIVSSRGMLRNSSSYPDLRLLQPPWDGGGDNRSKFFDDFDVHVYGLSPPVENLNSLRSRRSYEDEIKAVERDSEIPVDKYEVSKATPPPPPSKSPVPPPPPPPPSSTTLRRRQRRSVHSVPREEIIEREQKDVDEFSERKEIVDEKSRPMSSPPPPPPPAPPPSATLRRRRRRSVHSIPVLENDEKEQRDVDEFSERKETIDEKSQPAVSPPPQPPPPEVEEGSVSLHRKKIGATKEITTAISSLYKGQRKKKKKSRSRDIYESATPEDSPPSPQPPPPQATPPPPPPPPPPTKMFQSLFRKSGKSKRIYSISTNTSAAAPPPPPPPPPQSSIFNNIFKSGSKSKRFQNSSTSAPPPPPPPPPPASILNSLFKNGAKSRRFKTLPSAPPPPPPPPPAVEPRRRQPSSGKPPKPTKTSVQYQDTVIIAPPSPLIPMPSPLIPMPPPPPPLPFKMPDKKFVAKGDFVRIRSTHSSRCSSPDLEDIDDVMSMKSDGAESVGPPSITCPSPDVNVKADTFIARLRGEWRLEKMNSMKGKSN